jgi:RNA polymerase sigma-70 factor (ECF subfamily)
MLGSAAEAEDAVQDCWMRVSSAPDDLESARAWLTTVMTRLCIDRLKTARTRREEYVGAWLPEPVTTTALETAEDLAARQESITMAFLVLLEALSPTERAAFLLREVFDVDYEEIASVLETSPSAARQLVHRAKAHVVERRPRFDVDRERQRGIISKFMAAIKVGDLAGLQDYLKQDIVYTADGGGKARAALHPVTGIDSVSRVLIGLWHKAMRSIDPDPTAWTLTLDSINGEPALLVWFHGELDSVMVLSFDGDRISAIRVVRNPDKLHWLAMRRRLPE